MLEYLLKSSACLLILLLFYRVFLENERMHTFKRFYLLGSLVLSLIIPLLVFVEYVTVAIPEKANILNNVVGQEIQKKQEMQAVPFDFARLLWPIYCIGLIVVGFKFIQNLGQLTNRIRKNPKQEQERCTHVFIREKMPPHTFLRFIFLNRQQLENQEIPTEVLVHEETHVVQKHSWDVLFIELLQVAFWFNPLMIFFKRAIKLNHEFLADQAVLSKDFDTTSYQHTLLAFSSTDNSYFQPALPNAINYSSIKKRFIVMKTKTSKKSVLIRSLLLLPLFSLLLYGFSDKKTITRASSPVTVVSKNHLIIIKINSEQEIFIDGKITKLENISTELNGILESNGSNNSRKSEAHMEAEGHLNIKLLTSIKKQLLKTKVVLTMITADSIIINEKDLDVTFKGTQFIAKDTLHIKSENGNDVIGTSTPKLQTSASRKQMAEYNKLAKHYNNMPKNNMKINARDVARMTYIYNIMSEKQRNDTEPFPDFPEPPTPPKAPMGEKVGESLPPPPPPNAKIMKAPVPPTPADHVKKMAKQGAVFYYEGKQIDAEKAIHLVTTNHSLNIDSRDDSKNGKPVVKISKDPIIIK